jgi:3-oxosteroid 1-dehydrogenase
MKTDWHETYDVVVVGTGGSGLTAAITAENNGMKTLVVEKMDKWGGSTAYSGGGLWIPHNFLMQEQGCLDSAEEALEYMEAVIEDVGPASSRERKEAFVREAPKMVNFLRNLGVEFVRAQYYPDYYPMVSGAKTGRVIEGDIFDGKKLGKLRKSINTAPGMPPIAMSSGDAYLLPLVMRTRKGFSRVMKIMRKTIGWTLSGKMPLSMGRSLVGQMMYILQSKYQTPVWLNSPLKEVIMENGRAVGVVVERDGQEIRVKANKGILLGAGGFPHNAEMRQKYQGVGADWTSASPGNTGDAIEAGEKVGGALALMDEAWWGGSFYMNGQINFSVYERSLPGCILVDDQGKRYVNESTSYVDFSRKMIDHDRNINGGAVPSWLIMDAKHRKSYLFGMMPPGMTPSKYFKDGTLVKADSIDELATKCKVDKENLAQTIRQFNSYAYQGIDEDFGRGNDIYDRYYSDPKVQPNSNLAPIENAPYYAIKFYPGDLGTKGGLLTDDYARVLKEDGSVIEGLYASGNNTASVMGRTYPGPGSTIGPACTFSYIAMNHLANKMEQATASTEAAKGNA